MVGREPEGHNSAEREPAEVCALDMEHIEEREQIESELLDAVGTVGHLGCSVAATVVARDAQVLAEQRHLRVPHAQVRAERVHHNDRGSVFWSIDAISETHAVCYEEVHCSPREDRSSRWDARARSINILVLPRYAPGSRARSISSVVSAARTWVSARETWRRSPPDATTCLLSCWTMRYASGLPICAASAMVNDSARTSPPLRTRFACMRAGSTCRSASALRTRSTAHAV